jgi:hypothetical protein
MLGETRGSIYGDIEMLECLFGSPGVLVLPPEVSVNFVR